MRFQDFVKEEAEFPLRNPRCPPALKSQRRSTAFTCDHVHSRAITYLHVQSLTFTCDHLPTPSPAFTCDPCLHLRSPIHTCDHMPSRAITCFYVRSPTYICDQAYLRVQPCRKFIAAYRSLSQLLVYRARATFNP